MDAFINIGMDEGETIKAEIQGLQAEDREDLRELAAENLDLPAGLEQQLASTVVDCVWSLGDIVRLSIELNEGAARDEPQAALA